MVLPKAVRLSTKRILFCFCLGIIIVYITIGYYYATGYVSADIARFGVLIYYSMESYLGLTFSWDVPTFTPSEKMSIYESYKHTTWCNHTACDPTEESFMLFAMRTPKAASTTLEELISKLAKKNKYVVNHETILTLNHPKFTPEGYVKRAREMAQHFSAMNRRVVSCAHIRFIDFSAFHFPQPHYVGTIRDPVLRMQSSYNYDFFADRPLHVEHADDEKRSKVRKHDTPTFVECVRAHMKGHVPESYACLRPTYINTQLRYYCGMNHVGCRATHANGEAALQFVYNTALANMNRFFRVVMVVERMEESVALLEKALPVYFRGATEIYNSSSNGLHSNVNTKLPSSAAVTNTHASLRGADTTNTGGNYSMSLVGGIPSDVREYLEKGLLSYEVKLYEAATRHMDHNLRQCGLGNKQFMQT